MKYALAAGIAVMLGLAAVTTGYGQTAMQSTPTTKILAIGTINPGVEREKVFAMLPEEVRETANLYLDGKIDQWYSQQNGKGVVFILNVTDPAAAHEMLEKLPLGQAHLMSFELIPLGPLAPLRRLSGIATKP
jgi:hypothetical protein